MLDAANPLFGVSQREMPSNARIEQALLGAIMANGKAYHAVADFLRPEHFADPIHQRIFAAAAKRIAAGGVADALSLITEFQNSGAIDEAGGTEYLAGLMGAYVGVPVAGSYGRLVYEQWQRREMISAASALVEVAFDGTSDLTSAHSIAAASMDRIMSGAAIGQRTMSLDTALQEAFDAAERAQQSSGPDGLLVGMRSVDEVLGGLEAGTLHVLGGRPGSGKSSLGWQWALDVARRKIPVLAVSLEMTGKELGQRALAIASGVPVWRMRKGTMDNHQSGDLLAAKRELSGLPLTIEDGAGLSVQQIAMRARAAKRKNGLGLLVIDHLHIIRPEDTDVKAGATWAVGRISGAMKRLAKDLGCPVLLLAQLNRSVEGREDHRPGLADLRQSGDIEQDADTVSFVYRPEYYDRNEPERGIGEHEDKFQRRFLDWKEKRREVEGKAELIIAKVRNGSPGTVKLHFDGELTRFREAYS